MSVLLFHTSFCDILIVNPTPVSSICHFALCCSYQKHDGIVFSILFIVFSATRCCLLGIDGLYHSNSFSNSFLLLYNSNGSMNTGSFLNKFFQFSLIAGFTYLSILLAIWERGLWPPYPFLPLSESLSLLFGGLTPTFSNLLCGRFLPPIVLDWWWALASNNYCFFNCF